MDQQSAQQPTTQSGDQSTQITPEIRSFLESLLADANMTTLDDGVKEEMISELYARLDNFLSSHLVDSLPPEEVENFITMNGEGKSKEEVEQFLKDKIPNSEQVFTDAFIEFRNMYLGNVAVSRNEPQSEPISPDAQTETVTTPTAEVPSQPKPDTNNPPENPKPDEGGSLS